MVELANERFYKIHDQFTYFGGAHPKGIFAYEIKTYLELPWWVMDPRKFGFEFHGFHLDSIIKFEMDIRYEKGRIMDIYYNEIVRLFLSDVENFSKIWDEQMAMGARVIARNAEIAYINQSIEEQNLIIDIKNENKGLIGVIEDGNLIDNHEDTLYHSDGMINIKSQFNYGEGLSSFREESAMTYVELYDKILYTRLMNGSASFYENFSSSSYRKLYFDFDIKNGLSVIQTDVIIGNIIDSICIIIEKLIDKPGYFIENCYRDVFLYTAHEKITEGSISFKKSYHIIIDSFAVCNEKESLCVFNMVRDYAISRGFIMYTDEYMDKNVYKASQLFRLPGCSKSTSVDRVKKLSYNFMVKGIKYFKDDQRKNRCLSIQRESFLNNFRSGLISYTIGCRVIDIVIPEKEKIIYSGSCLLDNDIIYNKLNVIIKDSFENVISLNGIRNGFGLIKQQSKSGYFCPFCQRTHTNENPYLVARKDVIHNNIVSIYFNCRRGKKMNLLAYICGDTGFGLHITNKIYIEYVKKDLIILKTVSSAFTKRIKKDPTSTSVRILINKELDYYVVINDINLKSIDDGITFHFYGDIFYKKLVSLEVNKLCEYKRIPNIRFCDNKYIFEKNIFDQFLYLYEKIYSLCH